MTSLAPGHESTIVMERAAASGQLPRGRSTPAAPDRMAHCFPPAERLNALRGQMDVSDVVGSSPAVERVLRDVQRVGRLGVTVLLTGETGTGKTQLAHAIHRNGPRCLRRFVEVNCAAIPENLLESELFGAMPGGHSTATRRIDGKVTAAEGGTLFLDEVGDLPLGTQGKLLQFLQSKQYYPVGASTALAANVRIVAATNRDLKNAVRQGAFRGDLYFRLQVVTIRMPALAERHADILALAKSLCERATGKHELPRMHLSPSALQALELAPWPGNVRQLEHTIEAAAIRAAGDGVTSIEVEHLYLDNPADEDAGDSLFAFHEETRRFQAALLRRALRATEWNVTAAAHVLGITRTHVYNLIKTFELSRTG